MASSTRLDKSGIKDKVAGLPGDPVRYTKAFHAFVDASNYYDVIDNWYCQVFPKEVVDKLVDKRTLQSEDSPTVRILGVGSGSGDIDLKMAQVIKSRFTKVHNTVVEPSKDQVALYRQLIEKKGDDVHDIEFDFREQTIEEYRQDVANKGKKFDFINAVHCLYHVDDHDDTIGYLYDSLEDGGLLLMVANTDTAGFTVVARAFPQTQSAGNKQVTTNDIHQSLEKRSISYKNSLQDISVDLTPQLEGSTPSEETDLVMDFITMTIDVRTQAPKFYEQFLGLLRSDPRCLKRDDDGKLLFNDDCEVVIVQK